MTDKDPVDLTGSTDDSNSSGSPELPLPAQTAPVPRVVMVKVPPAVNGASKGNPVPTVRQIPHASTSSSSSSVKNNKGRPPASAAPAAPVPPVPLLAPQQQQDLLMNIMSSVGFPYTVSPAGVAPGTNNPFVLNPLMGTPAQQQQQLLQQLSQHMVMAANGQSYPMMNFPNPVHIGMHQAGSSQSAAAITRTVNQFRPVPAKSGHPPTTIVVPGAPVKQEEPEMDPALEEDDDGGMIHGETYDQYMPSKLALGVPHPDPIVETLSLASVNPPDITYRLTMPEQIGDDGLLSSLQLEAIVYACQRHEQFLGKPSDGPACRAGYLIGDGAGVGKGRTIAGIIYENWLQGRKKSIWLSVSNDLKYDAERDLEDIGASEIKVHSLNKCRYTKLNSSENGNIRKGVVFVTYPCLIGESMSPRQEYGTRMKQLMKWCGKDFDGVLVFDECHRAKNLCPAVGTKATKTGMAVLDIQKMLPCARIVYASATGASEPRNMAYMSRLGLWGPATPFEDFFQFTSSIEKRGVSAMEVIAMDMKLRGMYIARQLSFSGVTFDIKEIKMDEEYCALYDDCVALWTYAHEQFAAAAALFQADPRLLKQMWGQFWGSHQRFFKYLCLSSKVKATVQIALDAVKEGKCAVIGLQSTGEARTLEQLEDNRGVLNDFVSTSKAVFQSLVEKHFPAFDRRKAFELVGITDTLNDEAEAALDEDPDEVDSVTGRPKRKGRHAASYKLPGLSDFEESDADDDEKPKASSSRKKRKAPVSRSAKKKPQPKSKKQKYNSDSAPDSSSSDDEEEDEDEDEEESPKKKQTKRNAGKGNGKGKGKGNGKGKGKGRKKKVEDSDSEDEPFEPTDSDEESDEDESGDDSNAKTTEGSSDSELSDFSDEDNPWVKMLEAQRAQRQDKKKKKANQVKREDAGDDVKMDDSPPLPGKSVREMREEALVLKQDLLSRFNDLAMRLPNNTLDDLVDRLGGPSSVAEMTGRKGRVVTTSTGTVEYEARNDCDVALELLNLAEKQRFMDGEKFIAIISEAASSGISLQADRRAKNQRRRVHITLELPWSADKAIQQFGRTHRSNQVSAPEYMFLITDLAGEKRFASAVARRLECLGALTHGDRRATDSRDLSMFNIDSKYGRAAVEKVLHYAAGMTPCPKQLVPPYKGTRFFEDTQKAMIDVGMLTKKDGGRYGLDKDVFNIGKFLNRLLGMRVDLQNAIFEMFQRTMDSLVDLAKREGRFEMGIVELGFGSSEVVVDKKLTFEGNTPWTKAQTFLYTIAVERGLNWEDAKEILNEYDDKTSGFYLSNHVMAGKHTICLAVRRGGQRDVTASPNRQLYCVYRPNSGMQLRSDTFEEVKRKGKLVSTEKAAKVWKDMYDNMSRRCVHAYWAGNCKVAKAGFQCDVGIRRRTYTVLSGSVLSVWTQVGEVLYKNGSTKRTQNCRVRLPNNKRIVGIIVPNSLVDRLLALLKDGWTVTEDAAIKVEHLSDESDNDDAETNGKSNGKSEKIEPKSEKIESKPEKIE